ncbi:MAG: gamma-glutamylcyclotransferase [Betaproteobacteria bacterium]|jgi:gamma-glutamylcyclotransferase (GGCT)/AIG2-like uncharacterized protein YtfP|nr:gamma-glutamylcyclotransferase [Betaproteobacteria bacterium]
MNTARLFVYGTLRKDCRDGMHQMLAQQARFVGYAQIRGRLYDLGDYPGLVSATEHRAWVRGEVYELENPSAVLARLDDYEGCGPHDAKPHEFERTRREIVLESAETGLVWVYLYAGSLVGKDEIRSGDYCRRFEESGSEECR